MANIPSKKTIAAKLPAVEAISNFLVAFAAPLPEAVQIAETQPTTPAEKTGMQVVGVNPETLAVQVRLASGLVVVASPFQWASKMLMKVQDTVENGSLTRGEKIAIGQRAKSALKAAGLVLPTAELKRPRAPKAAVEIAAVEEVSLESMSVQLAGLNTAFGFDSDEA